jgi:hypothetical protein
MIGIVACVFYLSFTGERERIFDVYEGGGHKDYIEYVAKHWTLPDPGEGWEYHQPPLYYVFAAGVRTFFVDNPTASDAWGRILALWFWVVFLQASMAALRIGLVSSNKILLFVSCLFCLWPAGIIHSVRIGNDNPVYMLSGLAFFFVVRWWYTNRIALVWWASLWIFAAIITKSNGLIIAVVLLGLIAARGFWHAILTRKITAFWLLVWRPGCIAVVLSTLGLAMNLGDNFYMFAIGESEDWLLSNVSTTINQGLTVNNGILNYLIFDLATFIQSPFVSTWEDQYGRQYFWNFLLRSSLTSEYFFNGVPMAVWGVLNGLLLLTMMFSMLYNLTKSLENYSSIFSKTLYRYLPWALLLIISVVFLLAYRIKVPLSCNTDFRYIYMSLVAIVFFVAVSLKRCKKIGYVGVLIPSIGIPVGSIVWLAMLGFLNT